MSKFRRSKIGKQDSIKRRSSGSSLRGKISAPIPIPDRNEFLLSTPGAGTGTPLGVDNNARGQEQENGGSAEAASPHHENGVAALDSSDNQVKDKLLHTPARPAPEAPPLVADEMSSFRSSTPSRTDQEKAQRKKSGLKSVFGRLFGRKKKVEVNNPRSGQHRSDPSALKRRSPSPRNAPARSASMPITEFNRALRSHSVLLENFPDVEHSDPNPNRASIVADGFTRRRRATTPSRIWTPQKGVGSGDWKGLSPRPASTQARQSWVPEVDLNAPIGMAVTSGSHPNRRSRSHGELRQVMDENPLPRRRSDEIRYWRESYDPGFMSPVSSMKPETEDPGVVEEELDQKKPEDAPQPFNFGLMGGMAGMKITQAADIETRFLNLEARVQRLENLEPRLVGIERSVSRLCYRESSGTIVLQQAPRRSSNGRRSVSATRSGSQGSESSLPKHPQYQMSLPQQHHSRAEDDSFRDHSPYHDSSRLSTKITDISYQPSFENLSSERHGPECNSPIHIRSSPNTNRPLSTSTTIRNFPPSSPPRSKDGSLTVDHYTALANMVIAEQIARQRLEALVLSLQQQVKSMYARSPRSAILPMAGTVLKVDPSNDLEHLSVCGEFSSFEQDDSSDDEGGRFANEEFQTPNEEQRRFEDDTMAFGNGFEVKSESPMDGEREREPRTLSLGQITMGVGA